MEKLQHYTIALIYYMIFIVGSLGIIAALLWIGIWFTEHIFRQLEIYRALIEFAWDRARYKSEQKTQKP